MSEARWGWDILSISLPQRQTPLHSLKFLVKEMTFCWVTFLPTSMINCNASKIGVNRSALKLCVYVWVSLIVFTTAIFVLPNFVFLHGFSYLIGSIKHLKIDWMNWLVQSFKAVNLWRQHMTMRHFYCRWIGFISSLICMWEKFTKQFTIILYTKINNTANFI